MSIRSWVVKTLVILFLIAAIFGGAAFFTYQLFEAPKNVINKAMGGPTPTPPPDPSVVEYARCVKVSQGGSPEEARKVFENFIAQYPDSPRIDNARDALGEINMKLFFSDTPDPGKEQYVIQKGDTISLIEKKTKVPGELIMRLNRIDDPTKLRIGEILNITKPQFALKLDHKTKRVVLLNDGKFFKQYRVGQWDAPAHKGTAPAVAKVVDKSMWQNNQRVAPGSKQAGGGGRWIATSATGYTLYSDDVDGVPKPPGGLGLSGEDMDELSTLIIRGTPVTIE